MLIVETDLKENTLHFSYKLITFQLLYKQIVVKILLTIKPSFTTCKG